MIIKGKDLIERISDKEYSEDLLKELEKYEVKKPKSVWEFTEDEKVILRNLGDKWEWIVRDKSGKLFLYDQEPYKEGDIWGFSTRDFTSFNCFNHLFQSVQWEDGKPCEFREFI